MMDRTIRAGLVALMCWALSACDPSSGDRELPVVQVDTLGGIVYVRNPPAGSVDTATLLTSIGALGAGGAPQPDEFGRVTSVLLDGQGSVFVADANAAQVREFSRDGRFVRSFGRSGQGPGEFTSLYSLGWMGDALLTMEPGKIQVLTTEGAHLESWQWLRFTGSTDYVRIYPTGEREGYVLGLMPPGEAGHAYIRLTPAGPQDTIRIRAYAADPATGLVCPHQSGMISFFSVPFSGRRLLAPAPDGRVAVAWSGDYRIAIITPAGDTVRVIERAYTAEPITDDEWTTATAEYRQFQTDSPGVRCDPLGMTRPERKAALQGLYFTHEGDLVAEVTVAGGVRYDIYDGDGVARSTVLAPTRDPSVAPHFRGGRVAQVALDDFDVQYVQVLEIGPQD